MTLSLVIATWFQPEWARCVQSWKHDVHLVACQDILAAYQRAYIDTKGDIVGYVHDDLICMDPTWKDRVMAEFDDPSVYIVGFAGATGHGLPNLYQDKFHIPNMVRTGFRSNLCDAETHGERFEGACTVAVLDGIALFARRSGLAAIGGWPVYTPINYFMYTEWLCCSIRRWGARIRMVGVQCQHLGGRSTGLNPDLNPNYEAEHRYVYEEFRDVLPYEVRR